MPTYEVTLHTPVIYDPVNVQGHMQQMCSPYFTISKVVKVAKEPFVLDVHNRDGFDHLFTDTQALLDAVRYDSTPGSFEDSVIEPIPNEDHPDWCGLCCEVHEHKDELEEQPQPTVDSQLHDSVVRLEGAVTQLKRALEEALRAVK